MQDADLYDDAEDARDAAGTKAVGQGHELLSWIEQSGRPAERYYSECGRCGRRVRVQAVLRDGTKRFKIAGSAIDERCPASGTAQPFPK